MTCRGERGSTIEVAVLAWRGSARKSAATGCRKQPVRRFLKEKAPWVKEQTGKGPERAEENGWRNDSGTEVPFIILAGR